MISPTVTPTLRNTLFTTIPSAGGIPYTDFGRVLDYSTQVGPFTIVDKSGEGNTATLYSGRGLTMDAVGDNVTYATGYSSAERTATLLGRFNVVSPVVLGGQSGFFTFYPTATGVWEELTATATVSGDLDWELGSDFDIGDLRVDTEHWTHNDWSDPTADGLNGKTIVDSGPNGYHGTCTGCSGFTGEGIDPEVAGIVGLDDAQWFNGVDGYVRTFDNEIVTAPYQTLSDDITIQATITPSEVSASSSVAWTSAYTIIELRSTGSLALGDAVPFSVGINAGFLRFGCAINDSLNAETHDGAIPIIAGKSYIVKVVISGDTYALYVDDVLDVSGTLSNTGDRSVETTLSTLSIGSRATDGNSAANLFSGTISDLSLSDTSSLAAYTGLGTTPWKDTIGSNDGTPVGTFLTVGQKRATIPQTADRNWNKYDWNGGTPILSATGTMLVSESDANDQIDALGTAILEPRRNTQQLNPFGEGEYSLTPDSDSLDLTTTATWELWCEPVFISNERPLISKYGTANEMSWELQVNNSAARLAFIMAGSDGNFQRTEYWSLNTQEQSMLSVTFDGGVVKIYQDAVLLTFLSSVGSAAPSSLNNGTLPVIIGGRPVNGNVVRTFGGKFGSAKIYNRALTADEVLTNYNTQKSLYGL